MTSNMNIKNPILWMIVVTISIILGSIFLISATTQISPQIKASNAAKVYTVDPTSFDWGNIAYSGAKATKSFRIKNTGTGVLELYNIRTSCHCTKAYLTIKGQDSPAFGMDMGDNTSSYIGKVNPGKEAQLTVVFDPAFHGLSGIGAINRFVEVDTNDSRTPKLTFTLTGIVVNK